MTRTPLTAQGPRQSCQPSPLRPRAGRVPSTWRICTPQERALLRRLLPCPLPPPLLLPWKDKRSQAGARDYRPRLDYLGTGWPGFWSSKSAMCGAVARRWAGEQAQSLESRLQPLGGPCPSAWAGHLGRARTADLAGGSAPATSGPGRICVFM